MSTPETATGETKGREPIMETSSPAAAAPRRASRASSGGISQHERARAVPPHLACGRSAFAAQHKTGCTGVARAGPWQLVLTTVSATSLRTGARDRADSVVARRYFSRVLEPGEEPLPLLADCAYGAV
jgi:hypothetical protein